MILAVFTILKEPILGYGVVDVVPICAKKKVCWINATAVVASFANKKAGRDRSIGYLPSHTVSDLDFAIKEKMTVTAGVK